MTTTATAQPRRDSDDQTDGEAAADRAAKARRSGVRKLVTPQNTATAVASAVAAFFVWRSEFESSRPGPPVATLTATVAELNNTVRDLVDTVHSLERKVESLTEAKTSFDAALNSFRLAVQNTDYRLGRLETDFVRIQPNPTR